MKPAPEWISVTEQLPETEESYISDLVVVCFVVSVSAFGVDTGLEFAHYTKDKTWISELGSDETLDVRFWMPIPRTPSF